MGEGSFPKGPVVSTTVREKPNHIARVQNDHMKGILRQILPSATDLLLAMNL